MSAKPLPSAVACVAPFAKRLRAMASRMRSAREQAMLSHAATLIEQQAVQIDGMAVQHTRTTQELLVARANWCTVRDVLRDTLEVTS